MIQASQTRRFQCCNRGRSVVAFAMITPVFLVVIMFVAYLVVAHGVEQLAAEAVRTSIDGLSDAERNSLAVGYVTTNANSYPLLAANRVTVNAATSGSNANVFVVTVQYDASGLLIYSLPPFVPRPPSMIVRSAAILRSGS